MLKLTPLFDGVLILADKAEEKTKSGIIIPNTAKRFYVSGTVYSVGPNVPENIEEGTKVVFSPAVAALLNLNEIDYHFIKSDKIYCIVSETE